MKIDCDIIRDLLPLYADSACSGRSREMVEEHLAECPACGDLLRRLRGLPYRLSPHLLSVLLRRRYPYLLLFLL